jgi:hypothetical protein
MAATSVSFVLDSSTQGALELEREKNIKFLLKALKEFAIVYPIAADASARLEMVLHNDSQKKTSTTTDGFHPAQRTDTEHNTRSLFEWVDWGDPPIPWGTDSDLQDSVVSGFDPAQILAFNEERGSLP